MFDEKDIIQNIQNIYDSNSSLRVLKDFERVLDELSLYVFKNWEDGELIKGPVITRHWVECEFMWPQRKMPDPLGGKKLLDYGCKITFQKDVYLKPRKIEEPSDMRPNSKKGIMDKHPIWIVNIKVPKELMFKIFKGSQRGTTEDNVDIRGLYNNSDVEEINSNVEPNTVTPEETINEPTA
jgi:hypothetical protein